jgi:hypothetical protein
LQRSVAPVRRVSADATEARQHCPATEQACANELVVVLLLDLFEISLGR